MGKGNRKRNSNYEEAYGMSGTSVAKKVKGGNKKADKTNLWVTLVIVALVVASLALWLFTSSGIMARATTVISSDNYDVNANMITYYENQLYSTEFNQYYAYYYQYFTKGDADMAFQYTQQYMQEQGKTLSSYYDASLDVLKEILILCESAKAEGITLDAQDKEDIEAVIEQYDGNFKQNFGSGVNKSDIRKAIELQALASKYYESYSDKLEAAVTADDISGYIENNKSGFYTADYLTADLTVLAEDYEDDSEGFAAAKALADDYAKKFEAAKTVDEFKTLLVEYTVKSEFDALAKSEIDADIMPDAAALETYKQEAIDYIVKTVVKGETVEEKTADEGTLEYAVLTLKATLESHCEEAVAGAVASQAYIESTDSAMTDDVKWLIDTARAEGDAKVSSSSDETEYTYTAYIITKPLHLVDTETRNVGHILVEAREGTATEAEIAAAKTKADEILAEYLAGEKTKKSFEELGLKNTADSNVFYDNVMVGDMVEEFENWLFDEARKEGDTGVVQTEFGFHVMLYRGAETLANVNGKAGVVSERYAEFLKANDSKVVINEKAAEKYGA